MHEVAQQGGPGRPGALRRHRSGRHRAQQGRYSTATQSAAIIEADLREPESILAHPVTLGRLIDLDRPVGLLLVAVAHFLADADDPWALVAELRDRLAVRQLPGAQPRHQREPGPR